MDALLWNAQLDSFLIGFWIVNNILASVGINHGRQKIAVKWQGVDWFLAMV